MLQLGLDRPNPVTGFEGTFALVIRVLFEVRHHAAEPETVFEVDHAGRGATLPILVLVLFPECAITEHRILNHWAGRTRIGLIALFVAAVELDRNTATRQLVEKLMRVPGRGWQVRLRACL